MATIAQFKMDEILPHIGEGMPKFWLETEYGPIKVKASSPRLECLKRNQSCVRCKLQGGIWLLEVSIQRAPFVGINCFIEQCPWCALKQKRMPVGTETPHLNLYGFRRGKRVLMTQDHIMPRHAGGSNKIENLQTMCTQCNSYKGGLLPHEYAEIALPHERATATEEVDERGADREGLCSVSSAPVEQASVADCAAE